LLATLNWRPVYDIEQRTGQHELNELASEKRILESEKRLKLLKESNARIERFEQELFSSSNQAPSTAIPRPHSQRTGWATARRAGELSLRCLG